MLKMNFSNTIFKEDLEYINQKLNFKLDKFSNSTILITGCAGFLGFYFLNYLCFYAKSLSIKKIIAFDNFTLGKPIWIEKLLAENKSVLQLYSADIVSVNLDEIKYTNEVNYVIHGASIASPIFYRKYPLKTIDANIWGLRKLLDFYKKKDSLKGFLFFSSSEIYGDPDLKSIPTNEEYRGNVSCHGPRACYDESKRFGETMCWIYASEFNMPIVIARPFNNYGPGMKLDDRRLPADFAKAIMTQSEIDIFSDGKPARTFCYVTDAIVGYFLCLFYGKYDYFNIGIEKPEISVLEMANLYKKTAKDLFNFSVKINYSLSDDLNYLQDNPNRRCPDISKANDLLNYNPAIYVEEGIYRFLNFLKQDNLT
jgi:UDP-glucuronate decarboxylase